MSGWQTCSAAPGSISRDMTLFTCDVDFLHVTNDSCIWVYTECVTSRANQNSLEVQTLSRLHVTRLLSYVWRWHIYRWHTTHPYECTHNTSHHAQITADFKRSPWVNFTWHDSFNAYDPDSLTCDIWHPNKCINHTSHYAQIAADFKRGPRVICCDMALLYTWPWLTYMWHSTHPYECTHNMSRHAQNAADFKHYPWVTCMGHDSF